MDKEAWRVLGVVKEGTEPTLDSLLAVDGRGAKWSEARLPAGSACMVTFGARAG